MFKLIMFLIVMITAITLFFWSSFSIYKMNNKMKKSEYRLIGIPTFLFVGGLFLIGTTIVVSAIMLGWDFS